MNSTSRFAPVSRIQRAVSALAALLASALVFVGVLSLATGSSDSVQASLVATSTSRNA